MREIKDYILKSNFRRYKSDLKILSGIYLLHHVPSDEIYVGQSKEIKKRWTTYAKKSKTTIGQPKLWEILEPSNIEDWVCYVLKEVPDVTELLDIEETFIDLYDSEKSLNCSKHLREAYVVKRDLNYYNAHLSKMLKTFELICLTHFDGESVFETSINNQVSLDVVDLNKKYTLKEIEKLKLPMLREYQEYIKDPFGYFGVKQMYKTNCITRYFGDLSNFKELKKSIKLDDNLILKVTWINKHMGNFQNPPIVLEKI